MLADLADEGKLSGAHLTIYRHPRSKVGVELRLDEAEEDRIARVFRAITPHRLFTFEIRELPRQELGAAGGRSAPPRRRVRSEHRPDEPGARGAASDPAAGGPTPDRLPRDPQDGRAGAGVGRSRSRTTTTSSGGSRRPAPRTSRSISRRSCARRSTRSPAASPGRRSRTGRSTATCSIGELRIMTARDGERDVAGLRPLDGALPPAAPRRRARIQRLHQQRGPRRSAGAVERPARRRHPQPPARRLGQDQLQPDQGAARDADRGALVPQDRRRRDPAARQPRRRRGAPLAAPERRPAARRPRRLHLDQRPLHRQRHRGQGGPGQGHRVRASRAGSPAAPPSIRCSRPAGCSSRSSPPTATTS